MNWRFRRSWALSWVRTTRSHISDGGLQADFKRGPGFRSLQLFHQRKIRGGVVFAGYGITAKEYNYDDYAGIDVKDKLVLILRHEPQENDDKSVFGGRKLTEHARSSQDGER